MPEPTIEALTARVAALEEARDKALVGERVLKVSYDGGSVEFQGNVGVDKIDRALFEAKAMLARAEGRGRGPFVPVFVG